MAQQMVAEVDFAAVLSGGIDYANYYGLLLMSALYRQLLKLFTNFTWSVNSFQLTLP